MSRWYLVLGLTVALFDEGAAANCTENCALCYNVCLTCKQGYYKTDGECEKCNPNCKRCYNTGLCYFDCNDGWYGQSCSHACSCSYGTCDKYIGVCPHQTDPPVSSSHDHEDYDNDGYLGKILGILALPIGMVVICCCCIKRKNNPDEEQMADDTTDIIPSSQKLLPGQTPVTTRSTNLTYPNFFVGSSVIGPPQRADFAPSPCATYSGQQTDLAPPSCTTYSGQQAGTAPPCPTYSGQQTDQAPPPCTTCSCQQTDIGPPPSYTPRPNMATPPSYESLFDSKKQHTQEPFT